MSKNIVIIGGGISGLTTLHYLNKRYAHQSDVSITLLEKNSHCGGTIRTQKEDQTLFETGPNGFLNNRPQTLQLIEELKLTDQLIESNAQSKIRFILLNDKLYNLPTGPRSFLKSPILSPIEKLRALCEPLIADIHSENESIYSFTAKRFGKRVADIFADPMVTGIHAGNAQKINLKHAFPRLYTLFTEHGSLIKAMKAQKTSKHKLGGTLCSFKNGMGILTNALSERYKDQIQLNQTVTNIRHYDSVFEIHTKDKPYTADILICATPAFATAELINSFNSKLSQLLNQIEYAPMAVAGLSFKKNYCKRIPEGFGYLVPSMEKKEILGVLIESNIFQNRCDDGHVLFRVMIGGMHHPNILTDYTKDELIKLAIEEIQTRFQINEQPIKIFFTSWQKAIPQYTDSYAKIVDPIKDELKQIPNLKIASNWWRGVAFNDCIQNAYSLGGNLSL